MKETHTQESLFGDEIFQQELQFVLQKENVPLEKEIKEKVKSKLMRSYALEKERAYGGRLFYNHRNVVTRFLSLLEHNRGKVLVEKITGHDREEYEEMGWKIVSYDLANKEDAQLDGFSLNFELRQDEREEAAGIVSIPFSKEDFSEIEFEYGESERDAFFDETVYVLENIIYENMDD